MNSGFQSDGPFRVVEVARWWRTASQEARFSLYASSIRGEKAAPPLEALRLAIVVAETDTGEVDYGAQKALAF